MKNEDKSFTQLLEPFGYKYDLRNVFDDFLTLSMCAVTQDPRARKSYYEDLYLQTIAPYKNDELRHAFPKAFARLVQEMEENLASSSGNDILGAFYEHHFSRKNSGQFFTPWPVCQFMAKCTVAGPKDDGTVLRVLDPTCGSGRMLLAGAKELGPGHAYYGIDLDHTCVKMTALNLFLNGVFGSEVMCADALVPGSFSISYKISRQPLGIFRIEQKEQSGLWHLYNASFKDMAARQTAATEPVPEGKLAGPQLKLF